VGNRSASAWRRDDVENPGTAGYAWRFGLAEHLGIDDPSTIQPHEEAGRFIPLRVVTGSEALRRLISDVAPLLHLVTEPEQVKAIQYVVSEMVRNVLEHSSAQAGAVVAAQYYPGLPVGFGSIASETTWPIVLASDFVLVLR